jgi:hypothetical protein
MIRSFLCGVCRTGWQATSSDSACPTCGASAKFVDNDAPSAPQQEVRGILNQSALARDVQDAEAHIAVGIAGVCKVIRRVEDARSALQAHAIVWLERARLLGIASFGFDSEMDEIIAKFNLWLECPWELTDISGGVVRVKAPIWVDLQGGKVVGGTQYYADWEFVTPYPDWLTRHFAKEDEDSGMKDRQPESPPV